MIFISIKIILEQNIDKINWLLLTRNPNAINLIKQNITKIKKLNWEWISQNPNIFKIDDKHLQIDIKIQVEKI